MICLSIAVSALAVCYYYVIKKNDTGSIERLVVGGGDDDQFFPIYIINLDRRTDRLQETIRLLSERGYDVNKMMRVRATDGVAEWDTVKTMVADDALTSIYAGYRTDVRELSKGGVGCYVSHVNLWNFVNETVHDDAVVVLEDDTLPTLEFKELKHRLAQAPADWDVILLGAIYDTCMVVNRYYCRAKRFFGTHGYIIRKKATRYLVPRSLPIRQQIDSWMSDLSESGELKIYTLRDSGWLQNEAVSNTDIQIPLVDTTPPMHTPEQIYAI